jgi:hypothetical protein
MNLYRPGPVLRTIAALLPAFAAPSLAAQTAWKDLVGQPMPAIHGSDWLNADGSEVTTAALLGKVWLFKFFATT